MEYIVRFDSNLLLKVLLLPLCRLATQSDSLRLASGLRDLGSEVSLVAMAPLTVAAALAVLSGSVWSYQLSPSEFDNGVFVARVTAKVPEKVDSLTWRNAGRPKCQETKFC